MRVRGLLLGLLVGSFVLVFGVGSALAGVRVHGFSFSFPEGGSSFAPNTPLGLTVDQADGSVYLSDYGNHRVIKFNSVGEGILEFDGSEVPGGSISVAEGLAVDDSGGLSNGDVYVADAGNPGAGAASVVDKFDSTGKYISQLTGTPTGEGGANVPFASAPMVAVAPAGSLFAGDVYVADYAASVVDVFDSTGEYVSQIGAGLIANPLGVAVNTSGDVYVANSGSSVVELESSGECVNGCAPIDTGVAVGVAVDPSTNDVYVDDNAYVAEYGPSGEALGAFGSDVISNSIGIGVYSATHTVYVADASNDVVYVFEEGEAPEAPVSETATAVAPTTAVLHGELNPGSATEQVGYYFAYSTGGTCTGGATSTPGEAEGNHATVSTEVTGLQPSQHYTFCLFAKNRFGATEGSAESLTTLTASPSIDGESAPVVHSSGATLQAQINPNNQQTKYSFQYSTNQAFTGASTIEGETTLEGYGDQSATVTITTGVLQANTTYYYRALAENATGSTEGPAASFATLPPAQIDSESVANVSSTSATLLAEINPLGTDTTYYFQYGTTDCATSPEACTSTPTPPGPDIGSAETPQAASVHIQGLQPNTTYHYRVIATNTLGAANGQDRTFTTQPTGASFTLPDDRQYELVSPPNKYGTEARGIFSPALVGGDLPEASEGGGAVTYITQEPPIPDASANATATQIYSVRHADGWSSRDIATPHNEPAGVDAIGAEYEAFSADLSTGLVAPQGNTVLNPAAEAPTEWSTPYLYSATGGSFEPLLKQTEIPSGLKPKRSTFWGDRVLVEFQGASRDYSHVVFQSQAALTPGAIEVTGSSTNLYEYADGDLQQVDVLPNNEPAEGKSELGNLDRVRRGAVSDDGSRVVWSYQPGNETFLYVRDMVSGVTVQADASRGGPESGSGYFGVANSDASRVFFTDIRRLTGDSTAPGQKFGRGEGDLYVFEPATSKLTDLTVDTNPGDPNGAEVSGVLGASEDGSYVYFAAEGVLASGATSETLGGCKLGRLEAHCNLYVLHYDGTSWTTTFITTLSGRDNLSFSGGRISLAGLTARVSPNGRYVTFMSQESLTGYDNRDAVSGKPDAEVYLYDGTQPLSPDNPVCVSCNPTGARPVGEQSEGEGAPLSMDPQSIWVHHSVAGMIPGWTEYGSNRAVYQSRFLSDDGRLFFDSSDALVPQDVNGREDVYEFESDGVGDCHSERGCVRLISAGTGSADSTFIDASATGGDVFFVTHDQLVSRDFDRAQDVYDAHVCSSVVPCFAAVPVVPPPCASGDGCKAAPSPQPVVFGAPSSATFAGAGNVTQTVTKPVAKSKHRVKAKKKRHKAKRARKRRAVRSHVKSLSGKAKG
jgi:hypothetical protein